MKRWIAIFAASALLLAAGAYVGFRVWLANAPPQTRTSVEVMSLGEFALVLRDAIAPRPLPDDAGTGRELAPGRGRAPWVMRSSLDGRPRILSLAVAPNQWLAYSTETASVHRFWQGELVFAGPAFDALHGAEPLSEGSAWLSPAEQTAWRVRTGDTWQPARVEWRAHGFDLDSGEDVWLRFDVVDERGRRRTVTEWPSVHEDTSGVELDRRWELSDGAFEVGIEREDGQVVTLASPETRQVLRFGEPDLEIPRAVDEGERGRFEAHDCGTCHGERERIVGPAWGEIAHRYQGANREAVASRLAARIIEGSSGEWGEVVMSPHPDLSAREAAELVAAILDSDPMEPPALEGVADDGTAYTWDFHASHRPESLHPSLRVQPIGPPAFTPHVGGLAWLPDGRLAVATWDRDGAVFAVAGWDGPNPEVVRLAEGLHEPLGLIAVGAELYAMQKQEMTRLVDRNGDDRVDEYRSLADDWATTSNFHEFGFGFAAIGDELFGAISVCVLDGGKSCRLQTKDRGKLLAVSRSTGALRTFASGFRTPNGVGQTPRGDILVTDNQGDWLPASKLMVVREGEDYGWRPPGETRDEGGVAPPAVWLPHHELSNSPTQPIELSSGPYAGHVVFGDVYNGGIKRAALEEVGGRLQGAAFHWTGGLRGAVHRLLETRDGRVVVGQNASRGNWGEVGKRSYGLELLSFTGEVAFEPLRISARPDGFEVEFGQPLAAGAALEPAQFTLESWYYVPTSSYGGPRFDPRPHAVRGITLSEDRRIVTLQVDGLEAGRVYYLKIDPELRSERGETLWVHEGWYTLNALPAAAPVSGPPPNTLTEAERAAGWRLLFDGKTFAGWKNYGASSDEVEGWRVANGALEFTRHVSFAGLVWNHVNPFTPAALDLMTVERFSSFELRVEWKVAPGGNSGIFYLVPDEEARLSWDLGLEMQVLDDERHGDGQLEKRRAGDLYDLVASTQRVTRPAGQWNEARIRVEGGRLRHWLNDALVVDITRGTPEWDAALAASKHAGVSGFGTAESGHITLQDHGDPVWYRNVKILELDRGE